MNDRVIFRKKFENLFESVLMPGALSDRLSNPSATTDAVKEALHEEKARRRLSLPQPEYRCGMNATAL